MKTVVRNGLEAVDEFVKQLPAVLARRDEPKGLAIDNACVRPVVFTSCTHCCPAPRIAARRLERILALTSKGEHCAHTTNDRTQRDRVRILAWLGEAESQPHGINKKNDSTPSELAPLRTLGAG
jgi:hypothetical protein